MPILYTIIPLASQPPERPLNAFRFPSSPHIKYKNSRQQKAIKPPIIKPSLLFFADILPIKLFSPGT
jgi:hypothetical protein